MSDSSKPCCSNPKQVLWTLAIFGLFGFLALIVSGRLDSRNPVNRAYEGEFTDMRTKERWVNLDEVKGAQSALVDPAKVAAALEALAKAPATPAPTDVVVPGSPTFLKQSQQPAAPAAQPAPATAGGAPAPAPAASPAPATPPAPKPVPAPAPSTPAPVPAPSKPAPVPAPAPAPK